MKVAAVDLFCGVGGLTHGLLQGGIEVTAGIDLDETCKHAYEENNGEAKFVAKSVEDLTPDELLAYYPPDARRVLVGCAPCQPYSSAASKLAKDKKDWKLLEDFADLVIATQPEVVSMENVVRLKSFRGGRVFDSFAQRLEDDDYIASDYHVYCPEYGIPQTRRRLVFFASKHGKVDLIPPTHTPEEFVKVWDAIGDLDEVAHGEAHPEDPLHKARGLSEINLARIKASKPGGTWEDWDDELVAACHKKKTGSSYRSVYGRMKWSDPAPTMTTQFYAFGSGRFGHPDQNRALTLREGAILQTFPKDYSFVEPGGEVSVQSLGRHIGNAVPVTLGKVIAQSICAHLEEVEGKTEVQS